MSGGLMGLLGGDNGAADAAYAQQMGVTPDMLAAQRMQSLGQIGGILLAAGQAGPVGQRGQIMSQLADVPGAASKGMLSMQQARLAGMKVQEAQEERAKKAKVAEAVSKLGLSGTDAVWAMNNPDEFLKARGMNAMELGTYKQKLELGTAADLEKERQMQPLRLEQQQQMIAAQNKGAIDLAQARGPIDRENAAANSRAAAQAPVDAKIDALVRSGVEPAMAAGLASGRYVAKEEEDSFGGKRTVIIDLSTGQPIGSAAQTAPGPVSLRPDQKEIAAAASAAVPTTDSSGKRMDYSEAAGPSGAVKGVFNSIGGLITGDLPFRGADEGANVLNTLGVRTVTQMTGAIPGRESVEMRKRLDSLIVKPGTLMSDPQSEGKLRQTQNMIGQEADRLGAMLDNPRGMTRAQLGDVRKNYGMLRALHDDYGKVLANFGAQKPAAEGQGGGTGGTTRSGIKWGIVQ